MAHANIHILNGQEQLKAQNNKYTRVDLSTSLRFQWLSIRNGCWPNEKSALASMVCAFAWSVVVVTLWLHISAPLSICSKCNLTNRKSKYFSLRFQECEWVELRWCVFFRLVLILAVFLSVQNWFSFSCFLMRTCTPAHFTERGQ